MTRDLPATLLRVAWLSILLGLTLEILLVLLALAAGKEFLLNPVIADLAQKTTWSTFVCVGLQLGTVAAKARVPAMGLAGLLAAPLSFHAARAVHHGTNKALSLASTTGVGPPVVTLTVLKALQYAVLGVLVAWMGRKAWGGALAHAAAGLATGCVFGGAIIALTLRASPVPVSGYALLSRGLNEIVFPTGCALVLFGADSLAGRLRRET